MAAEVERRLTLAFEALSAEASLTAFEGEDSLIIDLPVIDWDEEADIAGKMVQFLKEALRTAEFGNGE